MKFAFILAEKAFYPILVLCELLGVSRRVGVSTKAGEDQQADSYSMRRQNQECAVFILARSRRPS